MGEQQQSLLALLSPGSIRKAEATVEGDAIRLGEGEDRLPQGRPWVRAWEQINAGAHATYFNLDQDTREQQEQQELRIGVTLRMPNIQPSRHWLPCTLCAVPSLRATPETHAMRWRMTVRGACHASEASAEDDMRCRVGTWRPTAHPQDTAHGHGHAWWKSYSMCHAVLLCGTVLQY